MSSHCHARQPPRSRFSLREFAVEKSSRATAEVFAVHSAGLAPVARISDSVAPHLLQDERLLPCPPPQTKPQRNALSCIWTHSQLNFLAFRGPAARSWLRRPQSALSLKTTKAEWSCKSLARLSRPEFSTGQ